MSNVERVRCEGRKLLPAFVLWIVLLAGSDPANSVSQPLLFATPLKGVSRGDQLQQEARSEVLRAADWALQLEIPREPLAVRRQKGTYDAGSLASSKAFLNAGIAVQSVMGVLGVASSLTADVRYGVTARRWLAEYAGWSKVDAAGPDIGGAASLVGLVVGFDFFRNDLSPVERDQVLSAIERLTAEFTRKTARLKRLPLAENRQIVANNHNVVPACAAGLGALLLKLEGRDNGKLLDQVVEVFRTAILPAAFSPDGEYVDGTDEWLVYVMNAMTPFFEALRRNGGPNLWNEGNVRKTTEFLIQADSLPAQDTPFNYRWRYTLLAMAAVYRDRELQGIALTNGLRIDGNAKELSFPQPRGRIWYSSAWELLFYDPTLQPSPLRPRPTSVLFPNLGRAILRSHWGRNASRLTFRAGPRIGKDEGDNNAFTLSAFGMDLFPPLDPPFTPLEQRGDASYNEMSQFRGTQGKNAILVDGVGQFSLFDPRYRGKAARGYTDWLGGPRASTNAQARIAGFIHSTLIDYVAGEAGNAYRGPNDERLLETFRRHVFFVKDEYVIIVDDVRAAHHPRVIEWRFHAGRHNQLDMLRERFAVRPKSSGSTVAAVLHVLRPRLSTSIGRMQAHTESYRSHYVSAKSKAADKRVLAIFVIELQHELSKSRPVVVQRDDHRGIIVRVGDDLLAWSPDVKPMEWGDLRVDGHGAWLRPGAAAVLVEGRSLRWKNAGLLNSADPASALWMSR